MGGCPVWRHNPCRVKGSVMDQIHASKVTPFQGKKRQWRWRSLASLAAVLAIVVVGAGTMNEWRTGGMLGTEQSAGNASLTAPASGASAGDAVSGEIAPASKDQDQTETTAAGGADSEKTASQGGGQSGSTGTQDSRSMPGDGAQEPAATGEASQPLPTTVQIFIALRPMIGIFSRPRPTALPRIPD